MDKISCVSITYNEENNIGRALSKVDFVDEIVVIDSFSDDGTLDIVDSFEKSRVYKREFDNFKNQWNYGLKKARNEWVLALDADYICSPGLVDELKRMRSRSKTKAGYVARFKMSIYGRELRWSMYPEKVVFFRKDKGRFVMDGHSQRLRLEGDTGEFEHCIYHDDRKPLQRWLDAQVQYKEDEVEKLKQTDPSELDLIDRIRKGKVFAPILVFVYCLFWKGLILDGKAGWYYTLQRTYTEILLSLKLMEYELRNDN